MNLGITAASKSLVVHLTSDSERDRERTAGRCSLLLAVSVVSCVGG